MGRRRTKDKDLPPRVYRRRGKLYYVHPVSGEWMQLKEGLRTWAKLVEASDLGETLSALFARYDLEVLSKRAPKTRRNRLQEWRTLQPVFGHMGAEDVEPHHVWRYFRERGETEGARHEVRCLSALITYARQVGARTSPNPCYGLQLPSSGPRTRYVTDDEYVAVRDIAPTMVAFAMDLSLYTAMSQIDILRLEKRQLTSEGILFDRTKTRKAQLIEWNDELHELIYDRILKEPPHLRRFLICKHKGKPGHPYTSQGFEAIWQRVMRRAFEGVKRKDGTYEREPVIAERFTFHDIRAKSLSDRKTLEEAQKGGGHADPRITQRHYRRLPVRAPALRILDK